VRPRTALVRRTGSPEPVTAVDHDVGAGDEAARVSVWDHEDGTIQVVVPGNVGGRDTLVDVVDVLTASAVTG
jgi:hypothetical protein